MVDLIPNSFWRLPVIWEQEKEDGWMPLTYGQNDISISEDDTSIIVEAAVPGLDPEDIEVTFDKGMLWVKGEAKEVEEDKKKKFYRRASTSVSYRVMVPGEIDTSIEPEASIRNGVMKVAFTKSPKSQPKK